MTSKTPYENETASIHFEKLYTFGGEYKGKEFKVNVESTQNATFDKVFEGLGLGIPARLVLQSPNGHALVNVKVVKKIADEAASPFRPRRKNSPKRGKKVSKKSGKLRKNKKSKKLRN